MRRLLAIAAVAVLTGCSSGSNPTPSSTAVSPPSAGHVAIPRTQVSLRVPAGMEIDEALPGLRKAGTRTKVTVYEQATFEQTAQQAVDDLGKSFDRYYTELWGLDIGPIQNQTVAGLPGFVASAVQNGPAGTVDAVIVAFATDKGSIVMAGTVQAGDSLSLKDLQTVMTEARWSEQLAPGGVGFELTAAAGYQRGEGDRYGIIYTLGPAVEGAPELQGWPVMGQAEIPAAERRAYVAKAFVNLSYARRATSINEVTVAGQPGFEIIGQDKDGLTLYSVTVFTDTGHVDLLGKFDPATRPDQIPAFRAMTKSLVFT